MNQLISEQDERKYRQILAELRNNHAGLFTQKELAEYIGVSERTIRTFIKGEMINYWLLTQYAGIIGRTIKFELI